MVLDLVERGAVRRASDLAEDVAAAGVDRLLPVGPELRPLLPGGGLRRGSTVAMTAGAVSAGAVSAGAATAGAGSLVLALLAGVSASGGWSAVVGLPSLGVLAAAQAGVALERLALVPCPGPEWGAVVAALLDGVDAVVIAPPGPVPARLASRLAARARQRGSVLLPYGPWEGADLTMTAGDGVWKGMGRGHGRLRHRELTLTAHGRGAAGRPRRVRVRLPDATGRLAAAPASAAPTGRPVLTVVAGGAAA